MATVKAVVNGKRIGQGFAVGRSNLLDALGQVDCLAIRVGDCYLGRTGLIQYLRYARSATVKVVPNNSHVRIEHGSMGGVELPMWAWIKSAKRSLAMSDALYVEVVPSGKEHYFDNIGAREFAQALERALVVTGDGETYSPQDAYIILWGDGRCLRIMATDRIRLGEFTVPCSASGKTAVHRDDVKTLIRALKKAYRARVEFVGEKTTVRTGGETVEATATKLVVRAGALKVEMPPYSTVMTHVLKDGIPLSVLPDDLRASAYLPARETLELLKATGMAVWDVDGWSKQQIVRLTISPRKVVFCSANGVNTSISMEADTDGEGTIALDAFKLMPILSSLGNETLEIGIQHSETAPLVLTGDGFFYLVLPVNVKRAEQATSRKEEETSEEVPETPEEICGEEMPDMPDVVPEEEPAEKAVTPVATSKKKKAAGAA